MPASSVTARRIGRPSLTASSAQRAMMPVRNWSTVAAWHGRCVPLMVRLPVPSL